MTRSSVESATPSLHYLRSRTPKVVEKDSRLAKGWSKPFEFLEEDAFHPSLRTHKLKGRLAEQRWACSEGYDLRILFRFVLHVEEKSILPSTVGGHEEVY